MKAREGQRWYYRIRGHRLCYCRKRKRPTVRRLGNARLGQEWNGDFGPWRKIGDDVWYEIKEGSGLPQNLFHDLQEVILDPVMKITREHRKFRNILQPLRSGLAAAAMLFGCDLAEQQDDMFQFVRKHKPSIEFRVVDFHHHSPDEFFQKDKHGNIVKNRKQLPRRALGKLAEALRKRKRFDLDRWERTSVAPFRWLIVVFAHSPYAERNVWLVPAKSRKAD